MPVIGGEPQSANMPAGLAANSSACCGCTPQLGRVLTPDDNRNLGGHPVAVISDAFWRRRFNAAPDAIGREHRP